MEVVLLGDAKHRVIDITHKCKKCKQTQNAITVAI